MGGRGLKSIKLAYKCRIISIRQHLLNMLYPDYKFEFIPIIVGALGSTPTCLVQGIERLGFTGKESNRIINVLQQKSIIGTVKICKTFLGFAP